MFLSLWSAGSITGMQLSPFRDENLMENDGREAVMTHPARRELMPASRRDGSSRKEERWH
jgi:hypothetical protein